MKADTMCGDPIGTGAFVICVNADSPAAIRYT